MERCAYCGERVGDDALFVDDEIFCSEECMRDYGASNSNDDKELDDDDEEEEEGELEESFEEDDDDY